MDTQKIKKQPIVKENNITILNSLSNNNLQNIDEEETIIRDADYWAYRKKLHLEIEKIDSGESKLYSLEELDAYLDEIIAQYEN